MYDLKLKLTNTNSTTVSNTVLCRRFALIDAYFKGSYFPPLIK